MPQPVDQIPTPNDHFLLTDAETERIWDELRKDFHVGRDVDFQFISWIADPRPVHIKRGKLFVSEGERACFMVVTERKGKPPVRTFGMTPLKDFYDAVKESGHFVSRPHPAKTIFAHLVRAHLKAIGALTGLTEMDEKTYQKNVDAAHWLVEQAQGPRYERGVTDFD